MKPSKISSASDVISFRGAIRPLDDESILILSGLWGERREKGQSTITTSSSDRRTSCRQDIERSTGRRISTQERNSGELQAVEAHKYVTVLEAERKIVE